MFITGSILVMIYIIPYFWLINQGSFLLLALAVTVGFGVIWSMYGAVLGTFFAESYSADVRYTGVSLGYQIGAALVGGPAPLIATALLAGFNQSFIPVGLFVIACGIVSLVAVAFSKDRSGQPLD
jgi:hypothetical protein